jgi:hypothetical protein
VTDKVSTENLSVVNWIDFGRMLISCRALNSAQAGVKQAGTFLTVLRNAPELTESRFGYIDAHSRFGKSHYRPCGLLYFSHKIEQLTLEEHASQVVAAIAVEETERIAA